MPFTAGAARRIITPPWGVELAGLGYYLQRTWQTVRDDLTATALVVCDDSGNSAAIVAADLMYNDRQFVANIREQVAASTRLPGQALCLNFSHSHNAPTMGLILGGGFQDQEYVRFVAREIATAVIMAWNNRQPAKLYAGWSDLPNMTENRTRQNGPLDTRVNVLRADASNGQPLAVAVNFHAHPCVHMEMDLRTVSRDVPGEVVDQLTAALPASLRCTCKALAGTSTSVRNFVLQTAALSRRGRSPARPSRHSLARGQSKLRVWRQCHASFRCPPGAGVAKKSCPSAKKACIA